MRSDMHTPIRMTLTLEQIGDLVFQQLRDDDGEDIHARHAITFAIEALDRLGLIVRDDEA